MQIPKRSTPPNRILALILGALAATCSTQAFASEATLLPPEYSTLDRNNVDIASIKASFDVTDVSIGMSSRPLVSTLRFENETSLLLKFSYGGSIGSSGFGYGEWQALENYYDCDPSGVDVKLAVKLGSSSDVFCLANGSYVAIRNPAAKLIKNANGSFLYTSADGTKYTFNQVGSFEYIGLISTVRPDGLTTLIYYIPGSAAIRSVVRNDGLQLRMKYAADGTLSGAKAINTVVDYCDPLAPSCTETVTWPQSYYSYTFPNTTTNQFVVTDQSSGTTRITLTGPASAALRYISGYKPSSSATQDTVSYQYCDTPQSGHWLCTATKDGFSWQYVLGPSCNPFGECHIALTSQGPTANTVFLNHTNASSGVLAPMVYNVAADGLRREYDQASPTNRLQTITYPGGKVASYFYDSRGNVTSVTHTPQPGSPLGAFSVSAGYDSACSNPVKCNKPNWLRDALSRQTDYTYDPVHGGVLTVTQPAVPVRVGGTVTQVRPQTRYGYVQRYAWYKNASGTVVQGPSPIWLLSTEKFCRTTAVNANGVGCTTAADEVVTSYDYGPTTGANNLFLRGKTVTADGVTLRTCYAYDIYGNKISETSPNAGLTSCP